jgi:hypothetical protein
MTISHPAPPAGDIYVRAARQVLAEMPVIADIENPYWWLGRLSAVLAHLVSVASPGGMDNGQREVLGQALAHAIERRTPEGFCADCEVRPEGLCNECAADLDLTDAYLALGRELGIEVPR